MNGTVERVRQVVGEELCALGTDVGRGVSVLGAVLLAIIGAVLMLAGLLAMFVAVLWFVKTVWAVV